MKMKIIFFLFMVFILLIHTQDIFAQIIFDDFSYKSTEYPAPDSANSLFGLNTWLTNNGETHSIAWIKGCNFGTTPHYKIESSPEGIKLKIFKGITEKEITPFIQSGFVRRHGTYAARVKFGDLRVSTCIDQAYWLFSTTDFRFYKNGQRIQYAEEMDYEWSNCFVDKEITMAEETLGDYDRNYSNAIQDFIKLNAVQNGKIIPLKNCRDDYLGSQPLAGQWATCLFIIDTVKKSVNICLRVSNFNNTGIMIYSSSSVDNNGYKTQVSIKNHDLFSAVSVCFSNSCHVSFNDSEMDIDWFYYSLSTNMDFDSVEDSVRKLKAKGIVRINTTDAVLNTFNNDCTPDEIYLEGPDTIQQCLENNWIIKHRDNRWGDYITTFQYRFHDKELGWENDWRNFYTNNPYITTEIFYDTLEFNIICTDVWRKEGLYQIIKKIPVIKGFCPENSDIILKEPKPNPTISQVSIEFIINQNTDLTLRIYDTMGRLISNIASGIFNRGNYCYPFPTDELSQGVYFAVLTTNEGTFTKKINIFRSHS